MRDSSKDGPAWSRSFPLPGQENSEQHRNDRLRGPAVGPAPFLVRRNVTPGRPQWLGSVVGVGIHSLPLPVTVYLAEVLPGLLGTDSTLPIVMPKSQPPCTCAELHLRDRVLGEVEKGFIALPDRMRYQGSFPQYLWVSTQDLMRHFRATVQGWEGFPDGSDDKESA